MSKSPFITILTASLNSGFTIKKTLKSVKDQTFRDIEHIVIDGGSRDETLHILKEFENTYNLTWISEPDHGISDAINKGLIRARGCYILVIHADDYLLNVNSLTNVYRLLKNGQFDIWSLPVIKEHPFYGRALQKPIRILWWNHFKFIFLHQGTFVHKRVFDRIGNFKEQFSIAMDYDFFYRALLSHCTVKFGTTPVALMGGLGVGSRKNTVKKRILEEFLVQKTNEKSLFWRAAQFLFRSLYFPYKTHLMPKLKKRPMSS